MLSKGVNITITDAYGNTVLHIACLKGESETHVLEILSCYLGEYAEKCARDFKTLFQNRNNEGRAVIHIATRKNYVQVIRYLIVKGCNVNIKVILAISTELP